LKSFTASCVPKITEDINVHVDDLLDSEAISCLCLSLKWPVQY